MSEKTEAARRSIMLSADMHSKVAEVSAESKVTADDVVRALFNLADPVGLSAELLNVSEDRKREKKANAKRRRKLAQATEDLSPEDFEEIMRMIEKRA